MSNSTFIFTSSPPSLGDKDYDCFLLACWFLVPPVAGSDLQVFDLLQDDSQHFTVELAWNINEGIITLFFPVPLASASGGIVGGGTALLDTLPNDSYNTLGWSSFALSGRMSTNTMMYYVNGRLYDPNVTWSSTDPIRIPNGSGWQIGTARNAPGIALSDFYFDMNNSFFDLSDGNQTAKLFSSSNHPVFWGNNGELVTGHQPLIFLHGNAAQYLTDLGSEGAFDYLSTDVTQLQDYTPGPT